MASDGGRPRPWVLVTGDFTPLGGMDRANYELARYLADRGDEVHLVSHRVWPDLAERPGVRVHAVPRPGGRHALGAPLLDRAGVRVARGLAASGARVLVNGGNCRAAGAVNWVHYVHAAWEPMPAGGALRRIKAALMHRREVRVERESIRAARLVLANSERTRRDVIERLGVDPDRVRMVYLGVDAERLRPPTAEQRAEARLRMEWPEGRPVVAFVGAMGDRRKGFDTLYEAWRSLAAGGSWDAQLVVIGGGATVPSWRARARSEGLSGSIEFLGFRPDVPDILAACDALVSPARYEPYGLNVQEALCCGLPALVSASAGVAERYPEALSPLLLPDPEDAADLASRLRDWRSRMAEHREAVAPLAEELRRNTWGAMAATIADLIES